MKRSQKAWERLFRWSLWAKGINGMVEVVGGMLLLLTSSAVIQAFINRITLPELTEDPTDLIAHAVHVAGEQLGATRLFGAAFLLIHGVVKLTLVGFLLRRDIRAYPWAIAALSLFTIYQAYLTVVAGSAALLAVTLLDILIVILALHEYRMLARRAPRHVS